MRLKQVIAGVFGVILALLGLLWLLQGSDLVHIKPILCAANCEVVEGGSLLWQIIGVIMLAIGVFIIYKVVRNPRKH